MLHYTLQPDTFRHQWQVTLHYTQQNDSANIIRLANWVPGSYMIRDLSRHIIQIHAECDGCPTHLVQLDKSSWQTEPKAGEWVIRYTVYAYDLSVRGSYLTTERAFFDGAGIFLSLDERKDEIHRLSFQHLPADWQIATTLPAIPDQACSFQALSHSELIDHPFELGIFETLQFTASGIPHRIVLSGHYPDFDRQRLIDDVRKICSTEIDFFSSPPPFKEYLFLLFVGDRLFGGLEHLSSTALMTDRFALPPHDMGKAHDDYIELLSLISHEYFHSWNVKSIKPATFIPYQLAQESYTEQLWLFEGITSYYESLFLTRSHVIDEHSYLNLLAKTLTRVHQAEGRHHQTLAQSSFTAWTKYYKQNENSPNAIVSYYQKGALAALCLDLLIRQASHGKNSLDDIMRGLYHHYLTSGQGLAEGEWEQYAASLTQLDLKDFFNLAVRSTAELPLAEYLQTIGVTLRWLPKEHGQSGSVVDDFPEDKAPLSDFGAKFQQNTDSITLSQVFTGGSAEQAGLAAQDRIIAINHFQCHDFHALWQSFKPGECLLIHYFRHAHLQTANLVVQAATAQTAFLKVHNHTLLSEWLTTP